MLTKAKLKEHIDQLPDEFTLEELIENLIFIENVEEGLNQSNNGNVISTKELEDKMKEWF